MGGQKSGLRDTKCGKLFNVLCYVTSIVIINRFLMDIMPRNVKHFKSGNTLLISLVVVNVT